MNLIEQYMAAPKRTKLIVGWVILRVLLLITAVIFLVSGFTMVFYYIAVGSFALTLMTMVYGFNKIAQRP